MKLVLTYIQPHQSGNQHRYGNADAVADVLAEGKGNAHFV